MQNIDVSIVTFPLKSSAVKSIIEPIHQNDHQPLGIMHLMALLQKPIRSHHTQ